MEPKMKNMMLRIKQQNNEVYFNLNAEERDEIAHNIATKVINTTVEMLNGYERDELEDIMELSIINLSSLEIQFAELEMYAEALMMKDAINKIYNDLSEMVGNKL